MIDHKFGSQDISLSCFSIEDVDIQDILASRKGGYYGRNGQQQIYKAQSGPVKIDLRNFKDDSGIGQLDEATRCDIMAYICKLERNYKEVQSDLFNPCQTIQVGIENFPWNTTKKTLTDKYNDRIPLERHEKIKFVIEQHVSEDKI